MATRNKFEQLLEYVVNGEQAKAEELFHALVIEKSREIYESIIEDELSNVDLEEEVEEEEEMDEAIEDEEEEMDENFGMEDEAMGSEEGPAGDMLDDVEDDDMGDDDMDDMGDDDMDDMGGEDDDHELLVSMKSDLDELMSKFNDLMADEKNEPEHNDGIDDPDFSPVGDEEGEEEEDEGMMMPFEEEIESIDMSPAAMMREYVDKVGEAYKGGKVAGTAENQVNTKSTVAKKNDMGGTTANIAKGGTGSEKGTTGGLLAPTTKPQDGGNVNVPGAKNATKLSPVAKGHGAEKKGTGESGTFTKSLFK